MKRKSSSSLPKADLFLTDFIQMQKLKTIQKLKENQIENFENLLERRRPHANSECINLSPSQSPEYKLRSKFFTTNFASSNNNEEFEINLYQNCPTKADYEEN
jgi:hypothetical protein